MYSISNFIQTNIGPNFIRSYWIYLFTDSDQYLHEPLISVLCGWCTSSQQPTSFSNFGPQQQGPNYSHISIRSRKSTHKFWAKSFPRIRYCLPRNKNLIELRNSRVMLQVEEHPRVWAQESPHCLFCHRISANHNPWQENKNLRQINEVGRSSGKASASSEGTRAGRQKSNARMHGAKNLLPLILLRWLMMPIFHSIAAIKQTIVTSFSSPYKWAAHPDHYLARQQPEEGLNCSQSDRSSSSSSGLLCVCMS